MRTRVLALKVVVLLSLVLSPASLLATNGYFTHGYGTKSQGMAGAGVAFPLGPVSPATNPAALALSEPGWEIGVGLFNPNRRYEVVGQPSGYPGTFGLAPGEVRSGSRLFPVPHVGLARRIGGNGVLGLAAYANGGMNTNYDTRTFGFAPTGVSLSQMFVAPTVAARLSANHAVGVTAVLGYQMFKSEGLQAFAPFSSDAKNLTDNSTDSALGAGVRVGYLGRFSKHVSVGASYQSRIFMSRLEKYAGLFAEGGDFDIPSNWTVGAGLRPTEHLDIALDVQHVRYSEVKSVGNPMLPHMMRAALGADGGAGFGWNDMTVVKAGLEHRVGRGWAWRAGYSYGEQPIPESEIVLNILAPGVIEQHATFGLSRSIGERRSLDVALMRAFNKTVSGPNPLDAPGSQTIGLSMDQWNVTVGYSVRFK